MSTEAAGFSKDGDQGTGTSENRSDIPVQKGLKSSEITEELPSEKYASRQNLILDIPTRTLEEAREDFFRINMPPTPPPTRRVNFSPSPSPGFSRINESPGASSKNKSTIKTFLPKLSFKIRNTSSDIEKAVFLALEGSSTVAPKKPLISRTLSLTKLITPGGKKTSSLPVTPIAHSEPASTHGGNIASKATSIEKGMQLPIHRSRSVPELTKDENTPAGFMFRIVPATPRLAEKTTTTTSATSPHDDTEYCGSVENEDGGEDIPEEEAVCRICMIELGEGADTLKLECSCKGELSLAHQECAVKWFSIKGNRTCDVCKQEVQNLPVTLLRVQTVRERRGQQADISQYRFWQDAPILVIINMLAYFCFLEQLLVSSMGSGAIAMSLPFSCILGLLASVTATTMVGRKHIWVYATVQFALVVLAGHLFYSLIHISAVLAILLATFTGFGIVMCGASILVEILKRRRRWLAQLNQQNGSQELVAPDQSSAAAHQAQADSHHPERNPGDSPEHVS